MTNDEAIKWISELIGTMRKETSGPFSDPEYKDEVYKALNMANKALDAVPKLERRCFALTKGLICQFCRYNCEFKEKSEEYMNDK